MHPLSIRTALRRRLGVALLLSIVATSALAFAGCGGGGGDDAPDAESLLDRAFSAPIPSANVSISAELELDGLPDLDDPLRLRASGPYIRSEGELPELDMDVEVRTRESGGAIQTGFLSTGERLFVKFGGAYYEQSQDRVAEANRRLARNRDDDGGSLADLGLDARAWITDAEVDGEEEIGGVATDHVTGRLDVEAAVDDLNGLLRDSGGAIGQGAPQQLRDEDVERLSEAVRDPSFDIYVGREDGLIRRLTVRVDVAVPEEDRADVGGVTAASLRFSLELDDVGGDQSVSAPANARPIADLTRQLGSLGELATGSLGIGGDSGDSDSRGGGSSGGADTDDFERYGDCLEQAPPDDAEAIERCSQLLP